LRPSWLGKSVKCSNGSPFQVQREVLNLLKKMRRRRNDTEMKLVAKIGLFKLKITDLELLVSEVSKCVSGL